MLRPTAAQLAGERWDLVVIGGGIVGAFAAWDAALRGLRTLLLESGDFGSGASWNSLKIAHGGLRYLQSLDLPRLRESVREQAILLRLAPDLVRPLPCLLPLRGVGPRSAPAMTLALGLYALLARQARGRALRGQGLPRGATIGRERARLLAGGIAEIGPAALWYDGLIDRPERLLLRVVHSATEAGAAAANYTAVREITVADGRVTGVCVSREGTADPVSVRARMVLNATGAGAPALLAPLGLALPLAWASASNLVVNRRGGAAALAVEHPREPRMLFAVPWRERLLLGTSYARAPLAGSAGTPEGQAEQLLADFATALPELRLRSEDVVLVHSGLLPAHPQTPDRMELLDRPLIHDHAADGVQGLATVVPVKWTTARRVAEAAVTLCQRRLGMTVQPGGTDRRPLAPDLPFPADPAGSVAHAVRREMALHLADIVFRRGDLGIAGPPPEPLLRETAQAAAAELGWSPEQLRDEIAAIRHSFPAPVP